MLDRNMSTVWHFDSFCCVSRQMSKWSEIRPTSATAGASFKTIKKI